MRRPRRFRDLPLIARLLIPFLALMLFVGGFGVVVIVNDLSTRGRTALEQDLSRRLLEARSALRDRELYLVESANFASNVEGIATHVRARDEAGVTRLMQSVLALKTDVNVLAVMTADGAGLLTFTRRGPGGEISTTRSAGLQDVGLVSDVLRGRSGGKASGFISIAGRRLLAIAAPICTTSATCAPDGVAVVAIDVDALVRAAPGSTTHSSVAPDVAIFDPAGALIARSGADIGSRVPALRHVPVGLRTQTIDGVELATAYAPLEVQGRGVGTLAVTSPTAPVFASARGTGSRLAFVVVAAMAGIIALGALLSRSILAQVKPLVATNRALGQGDLSARAVVLGEGELGELARGVNQMAEQLQAMYANLELRVEQRTEEIRRLLSERTEFFASISHELRTPLAAILGQGKMMLDPKYPKNQRWAGESGHMIVETANQLITVVNEILDLARAESGRLELTMEDVDVGGVLKELTPALEALARRGNVHLTMVRPIERMVVRVDRRRLHGIMVNLVDNAVKYTPSGGGVTVTAETHDHIVEVSVSDTGVGIPLDAGDLIFEPFFRVRGATAQGGQASSGLGLALCKRLLEAQEGSIRFVSEPDHGSTFTISLPRVVSKVKNAAPRKRGFVAGA